VAQVLTVEQLDQYRLTIVGGGVDAVRQVYIDLHQQGYAYAGWAYGVATGEFITGQAALDFLKNAALMGVQGRECKNITPEQMNKIRVDMALAYIDTLSNIAGENGGEVSRDVNLRETEKFHADVFVGNGLSINNWTLKYPMDLIRQQMGDAAAENIWKAIRSTEGGGWLGFPAASE
jgi:hypothetical protein